MPTILAVALLAGCQSGQRVERPPLDHQPLVDAQGRPRSLAFAPPRLQAITDQLDGLPWYADRTDARLTVRSGVELPITTITLTDTVDREHFHDNRPHHHYDRTTRRHQITIGTR